MRGGFPAFLLAGARGSARSRGHQSRGQRAGSATGSAKTAQKEKRAAVKQRAPAYQIAGKPPRIGTENPLKLQRERQQ
jgi:hypothetical protein